MLQPPLGPEDHVIGNRDAPIVLVEYGDYHCLRSARAYAVLRDLLPELDDAVCYGFRNFPLRDIVSGDGCAAEAAESVAVHSGEEAFWKMHSLLFENQDALEVDDLLGYAGSVGADTGAVADDLRSGVMRKRLSSDVRHGLRSGVETTPTFFMNGRRLEGNWADALASIEALRHDSHQPH